MVLNAKPCYRHNARNTPRFYGVYLQLDKAQARAETDITYEGTARPDVDRLLRNRFQCQGSKAPIAVDTPGHPLRVVLTPANEQERAQVGTLCRQVQEVTGRTGQVGSGDQGHTGV